MRSIAQTSASSAKADIHGGAHLGATSTEQIPKLPETVTHARLLGSPWIDQTTGNRHCEMGDIGENEAKYRAHHGLKVPIFGVECLVEIARKPLEISVSQWRISLNGWNGNSPTPRNNLPSTRNNSMNRINTEVFVSRR